MRVLSSLYIVLFCFTNVCAFSDIQEPDISLYDLHGPVQKMRKYSFYLEDHVSSRKMSFDENGYLIEDWIGGSEGIDEWWIRRFAYNHDYTVCETTNYRYREGTYHIGSKYIYGDTFEDGTNYIQYDDNGDIEYTIRYFQLINENANIASYVDFEIYDPNGLVIGKVVSKDEGNSQWLISEALIDPGNMLGYSDGYDSLKKFLLHDEKNLLRLSFKGDYLRRAMFVPSFTDDNHYVTANEDFMWIHGWDDKNSFRFKSETNYKGGGTLDIDNEKYKVNVAVASSNQLSSYSSGYSGTDVVAEMMDKNTGYGIKVWLDKEGQWHTARFRERILVDDYDNWIEKRTTNENGSIIRESIRDIEYYDLEDDP